MTATPVPFNPFDYPTWWPPVERQLAAGTGVASMSLLRRFITERNNGVDTAEKFARARIEEAVAEGKVTTADAERLYPFLSTTRDSTAPTAAEAFQEAYDDPDSSPFALAALSLLKEHAEQQSARDEVTLSDGEVVALVAIGALGGPLFAAGFGAGVAAVYVSEHLHWR
jgi:hypothetical protein